MRREFLPSPTATRLFIGFCLFGFIIGLVYVVVRAASISFTHDEALSYLQLHRWGILSPLAPHSNNHYLNTWAVLIMNFVFGPSEFFLRLPNILALVLFAFAAAKIAGLFANRIIAASFFLALLFNPFELEYFSLERGYGLALGFMMFGLWQAFRFARNAERRALAAATISNILAVVANVAFLNYFIAAQGLLGVIIIRSLFGRPGTTWKSPDAWRALWRNATARLWLLSTTVFLCLISVPIAVMKVRNQLYFGGDAGFIRDTLISLFRASLYGQPYTEAVLPWCVAAFGITGVCALVFSILSLRASKAWCRDVLAVGTAILISMIILTLAFHAFFGVKFVMSRSALYFYPFFVLCLFLTLQRLAWPMSLPEAALSEGRGGAAVPLRTRAVLAGLLAAVLAGGIFVHFVRSANTMRTFEWSYDADTRRALLDFDALLRNRGPDVRTKFSCTFGVSWVLHPAASFYQKKFGLWSYPPLERDKHVTEKSYDYFYLIPEDFAKLDPSRYDLVKRYAVSECCLVKRRDLSLPSLFYRRAGADQ